MACGYPDAANIRMVASTCARSERAWASWRSYLIEAAILELFRFNLVRVLVLGIGANPSVKEYSPAMYWAIFSSSAIGTAFLAFELLKTWGLA